MSRNGSGTYNLPAGNPVVTATTISSSWANTTLSDIASALTGSIAADGQTPITANLNLNNNKLVNVADPTNAQDAATKTYTDAAITAGVNAGIATVSSVITGSIQMWPTNSAPTGYLICNGAAVSRTTYAALFAAIGTTFGVGDNSTTFNLPDYRDRMPIGAGNLYNANSQGGSKDAIVVSHTHTGSTSTASLTGTVYGISESFADGGGTADGVFSKGGGYIVGRTPTANDNNDGGSFSINASHNHSFTTASSGSSGTNANLPPYLGIYFIIKT